MKTVKLYYYSSTKDTENGILTCSTKGLVAVDRQISISQTPLQDTIRLLMQGTITDTEKRSGMMSNFPLIGVSLDGASVDANGTLTLTFSDPQHSTSGGACRSNVLRAQIEATAKQFPTVKQVRIQPATLFQP